MGWRSVQDGGVYVLEHDAQRLSDLRLDQNPIYLECDIQLHLIHERT